MMTWVHQDLCCQSTVTAGYNTASNVEFRVPQNNTSNAFAAALKALEGLAEEMQYNSTVVANLTTANNTLTNQVKTMNVLKGMIKDLVQEMKTFNIPLKKIAVNTNNANDNTGGGANNNNEQ